MSQQDRFPVRAQIGSERKKYSNTSSLRPKSTLKISSLEYRLRGEAKQLLEAMVDDGRIPVAWRKNIPGFLHNCAKQVPYVKNWVWALYVMRTKKTTIHAPMKYFKYVLLDVKNFRFNHPNGLKSEVAGWLRRTKGVAAARKYALTHGLRSKQQVERYLLRKSNNAEWERGIRKGARGLLMRRFREVYDGKVSPGPGPGGAQPSYNGAA